MGSQIMSLHLLSDYVGLDCQSLGDKAINSLHRAKWFCKMHSESYQPDAFIKLHL